MRIERQGCLGACLDLRTNRPAEMTGDFTLQDDSLCPTWDVPSGGFVSTMARGTNVEDRPLVSSLKPHYVLFNSSPSFGHWASAGPPDRHTRATIFYLDQIYLTVAA